jgi:hypothetical protein
VVDREQLDRGYAEVDQMREGAVVAQTGVGPLQRLGHRGMGRGEALDMDLVDHRVGVAVARPGTIGPVEGRVHHQAARDVTG